MTMLLLGEWLSKEHLVESSSEWGRMIAEGIPFAEDWPVGEGFNVSPDLYPHRACAWQSIYVDLAWVDSE